MLQDAKLELRKSKRKDYYKILGVGKAANDEEVKKAYRKRAMVHHPDRHSGATEQEKKDHEHKFKEVIVFYFLKTSGKKSPPSPSPPPSSRKIKNVKCILQKNSFLKLRFLKILKYILEKNTLKISNYLNKLRLVLHLEFFNNKWVS